jgi:hypothetical protein
MWETLFHDFICYLKARLGQVWDIIAIDTSYTFDEMLHVDLRYCYPGVGALPIIVDMNLIHIPFHGACVMHHKRLASVNRTTPSPDIYVCIYTEKILTYFANQIVSTEMHFMSY